MLLRRRRRDGREAAVRPVHKQVKTAAVLPDEAVHVPFGRRVVAEQRFRDVRRQREGRWLAQLVERQTFKILRVKSHTIFF